MLHDAPEYVVGDLISPFKTAIGLDYKAFENRLMEAIHLRFGLPPVLPDAVTKAIKAADRTAAYFEATCLAGFGVAEAEQFFGTPDGLNAILTRRLATLEPWPAADAQRQLLARFSALSASV